MRPVLVFVAVVVLSVPNLALTADSPDLNGYWWESMTPTFKLG